MSTAELRSWLQRPDVLTFPYCDVVREYHGRGKHSVSPHLLSLLTEVRVRLPALPGPWPQVQMLASFLDTALDKADRRYDYPSYLALALLPLPAVDDPIDQAPFARVRCDRITVQLVSDALGFELAVADGRTAVLPRMRPAADLVGKRHRHGLRVVRPALARMALDAGPVGSGPVEQARQACAAVRGDMSATEARAMQLSILPVHTAHDEYLFLRVLQTFETTFALLAVQLRGALEALRDGRPDRAASFLTSCDEALGESAPLFSMLATMQIDSFRTFRELTDGASAIQSRNYKFVEALCREPDPERLDSAAYRSVPEVRAAVLDGLPTLDDAYRAYCASSDVDEGARERLAAAMRGFARTMLRWRRTHYRLAVRMLGSAPGTGYTEGTPYLDATRAVPVFDAVGSVGADPGGRPLTSGRRT